MFKTCDNCFFDEAPLSSEVCGSCAWGGGGDYDAVRWVAVDFLKDVPDNTSSMEGERSDYDKFVAVNFLNNVPDKSEGTSSMEGEKVMEQMLQQLQRIKASESANNAATAASEAAKSTLAASGVKYDSEKPKWSLLPFKALQEVVEVLTFGAKKYASDNWKHVPQARERYVDAAYRHLADWNAGEKKDPETGKSHLAHAVCCLLFLLWFEQKDQGAEQCLRRGF